MDECPEDLFNRILWHAQKGSAAEYPAWAVTVPRSARPKTSSFSRASSTLIKTRECGSILRLGVILMFGRMFPCAAESAPEALYHQEMLSRGINANLA